MPIVRSVLGALEALPACPWEGLVRRALALPARALDLRGDLQDLRPPWRLSPPPGVAACGTGGSTWMPVVGACPWDDDPDVHADGDLLRRWSRGRLREVLHAALVARERRDADAAAFAVRRVAAFARRCPEGECDHWRSGMEIALRGMRLLHAASHLRAARADGVAVPDTTPLALALVAHERALESRTDWRLHRTGNHYLVVLAARVILASSLPPGPEREHRAWRDAALLEREARRQFGREGLHFESALGYHVLAAEAVQHALAALKGRDLGAGLPLGPIGAAFGALLRPDGTLAAMGDCDDESFVPASVGPEPPPPLRAAEIAASFGAVAGSGPSCSQALFERGCFVLASPGPPALHATVSAFGPGRAGTGGHSHDDATSYDLWLDGPLVVDRGTGAYASDPALRERLRGARSHALLQVDDREMNDAVAGEVFQRRHRAHPFITAWDVLPDGGAAVSVGHHGFVVPAPGAAVLRTLRVRAGAVALEVEDNVSGAGTHDLTLRIPWTPGAAPGAPVPDADGGVTFEVARRGAARVQVRVDAAAGAERRPVAVTVRHVEAPHSPRQGEIVPALTTEVRFRSALPVVIRHVIAFTGADDARPPAGSAEPA